MCINKNVLHNCVHYDKLGAGKCCSQEYCYLSEESMKYLSLLTWVTQLGFSILFPTCAMLLLANWLQHRFGLGPWIMVLLGIIGFFTSISTTKSCIRSLIKAAAESTEDKGPPPGAFNAHS